MRGSPPGLVITVVAFLFLAADGVLLIWAGIGLRRPSLVAWGAVFALAALLVVPLYRRYLRELDSIREARRSLALEIEMLKRNMK